MIIIIKRTIFFLLLQITPNMFCSTYHIKKTISIFQSVLHIYSIAYCQETRQQQTLWAEPCYLVTSHEAQVAEGLAALSDLCGSLVCDILTPAGIHSLYGTAVLANGYQSCGRGGETRKGVSLTTCFMQMWQHRPPKERHRNSR